MSKYSVKMQKLLDESEKLKDKMAKLTKKEIKAELKGDADKKRIKSLTIRNMLLPYQADSTFWLSPNSRQKTQGCAHFSRKSYTMPAKIPELVVPPQTAVIFYAVTPCFPAHRPMPCCYVADVTSMDGLFWALPGVELKP